MVVIFIVAFRVQIYVHFRVNCPMIGDSIMLYLALSLGHVMDVSLAGTVTVVPHFLYLVIMAFVVFHGTFNVLVILLFPSPH